jgi:hypothetical protein
MMCWRLLITVLHLVLLVADNSSVLMFGLNFLKWLRYGQAMYVYRNIEARLCNHCCSGKSINITYSECVFVAFCVQYAVNMRHIVIRALPRPTVFSPHYLINGTIFERGGGE